MTIVTKVLSKHIDASFDYFKISNHINGEFVGQFGGQPSTPSRITPLAISFPLLSTPTTTKVSTPWSKAKYVLTPTQPGCASNS
jgi:hypothetical protein